MGRTRRDAARVLTPAELAEFEADNRAFATREPAAMERYARECAAATATEARHA